MADTVDMKQAADISLMILAASELGKTGHHYGSGEAEVFEAVVNYSGADASDVSPSDITRIYDTFFAAHFLATR